MSKRKATFHILSVPCVLILCLALWGMVPLTAQADICTFSTSGSNVFFLRNGDSTHFLMDGACFVLSENQTLEPCTRRCAEQPPIIYNACTTPGHITYGFGSGTIYQWCPDQFTPWKALGHDTQEIQTITFAMAAADGVYYRIGKACDEFGQVEDDNWTVVRHDIATNKERTLCVLPAASIRSEDVIMAVQPDGSLAIALWENYSTLRLTRVDTETGRTSTLATVTLSSQLYGLACREDGGWYALLTDGLYLIQADGSLTLVNYMAFLPYRDTVQLEVYSDCVRFIGSTNETDAEGYTMQGLYTIPLAPQEVVTLRVAAPYIDSNTKLEFEQQHPGVIIQCLNDYQQFEKVSEALISGNPIIDLMLLRSYDGGLTRALSKGYCCDLSDRPEISEFVSKVYPIFQQEVTRDGRIMAVPLEVAGTYRTGYLAERWEDLALGEKPQTYEELLNCITEWVEDDLLDGTPIIYGGSSYIMLRFMLMEQYIARAENRGEIPFFQDDTFLDLLERLQAMKPMLDAYDNTRLEGDALLNCRLFSGIRSATDPYEPLPMGFDSAADRGETVQLVAGVVNPQSEHQELAKELLVMMLDRLSFQDYYQLVDEVCEGVENPYYSMLLENNLEYVADLEAQLKQAEADEDTAVIQFLSDELLNAQAQLEYIEATHYYITAEDAAYYRQLIPHMAIEQENGLFFLMENAANALNGLEDGKLSARDLAKRLDQILQAWEQENQ